MVIFKSMAFMIDIHKTATEFFSMMINLMNFKESW